LDGANGDEIDGMTVNYNWDLYYSTIRHYQPDALIANMGPDVRWIGNEDGLAEEMEWCIQPKIFSLQPTFGGDNNVWFPSECDVSIRPGWFYHSSEDQQVKSADALKDIYLKSVGRNSNLLLNVPPNKDGLISNYDIAVLKQWKDLIDNMFSKDIFYQKKIESSNTRNKLEGYSEKNCLDNNRETFWVTDKNVLSAELIINLDKKEKINMIRLEEAIEYGQRIKLYSLYFENNGQWEKFYGGSTVGRSRILTFNTIETTRVKITIEDSYASPTVRTINAYYSN
ncbi:MAG: discoidin domain-containing protein, partial [Ignavibacteriaceae bacterium]